jgi:hypothetical protein
MKPRITFAPATPDDAAFIAAHLRAADRVELAVTDPGKDVGAILAESVRDSRWSTVVRVDGVPAIVYGVAPTEVPHVGSPWMLATDDLLRIRAFFLRHCRTEVAVMHASFVALYNRVHRDNVHAIRWLEYCGFTVRRGDGPLFDFYKGAIGHV